MENRKTFFFNKGSHQGNIKLVEGFKLVKDNSEVEKELTNFFKEAVLILDVNKNSYIINSDSFNIPDSIEKAIIKYKFHARILLTNDKTINQGTFSFKPISKLDIEKEVHLMNLKNATICDSISPKILKINSEASVDVCTTFSMVF